MPDIVLIAHGSPDPRHREGLETLAEAVRARVRPGRAARRGRIFRIVGLICRRWLGKT